MISLLRNTLLRRNIVFKPALWFADSFKDNFFKDKVLTNSQTIPNIKESAINDYPIKVETNPTIVLDLIQKN